MNHEKSVHALYTKLISAWNDRNAEQMSSVFESEGMMVGFDGSSIAGKSNIYEHLHDIFRNHVTAPFISIMKGIRFPKEDVALLQAIVGMIPHGETNIKPELNAIQTLVAICNQDTWKVAHFQNTPAALHGRPELVAQMTAELENQYNKKGVT